MHSSNQAEPFSDRYHSIVFLIPSSNVVIGSQPNSLFALAGSIAYLWSWPCLSGTWSINDSGLFSSDNIRLTIYKLFLSLWPPKLYTSARRISNQSPPKVWDAIFYNSNQDTIVFGCQIKNDNTNINTSNISTISRG